MVFLPGEVISVRYLYTLCHEKDNILNCVFWLTLFWKVEQVKEVEDGLVLNSAACRFKTAPSAFCLFFWSFASLVFKL